MTDTEVRLTLSVPPTANDWAKAKVRPHSKESKAIRERIKAFTWEVKAAALELDADLPFTRPVFVYIDLHHSGMDLDNVRKVLNDSLQAAGVLANDKLIKEDGGKQHASKRTKQHIVVTIREIQ